MSPGVAAIAGLSLPEEVERCRDGILGNCPAAVAGICKVRDRLVFRLADDKGQSWPATMSTWWRPEGTGLAQALDGNSLKI
jgi:hypothetical protein